MWNLGPEGAKWKFSKFRVGNGIECRSSLGGSQKSERGGQNQTYGGISLCSPDLDMTLVTWLVGWLAGWRNIFK